MPSHGVYLLLELTWALPVLAVQWVVGWQTLWSYRATLVAAIALPTMYLSFADGVAISHGIWILHQNRILGVRLGDVPVEEVIFFLLTNALVVQAVLLVSRRESKLRANSLAKVLHPHGR